MHIYMYTNNNLDNRYDQEYDFLYKIVLAGDSGVGKSNLLSRWTNDEFIEESKSTIGVEFAAKNINIDNKIIKAQIWDTAGQERYRAITTAYYRGAVGALIVYDITDPKSFEHINVWYDQLHCHMNTDIIIMIIGNKCDLRELRKVSVEDGKQYAMSKNVMYLETSAKNNDNVDKAFEDLLISIYEKNKNNITNVEKDNIVLKSSTIPLQESDKKISKKEKCCDI